MLCNVEFNWWLGRHDVDGVVRDHWKRHQNDQNVQQAAKIVSPLLTNRSNTHLRASKARRSDGRRHASRHWVEGNLIKIPSRWNENDASVMLRVKGRFGWTEGRKSVEFSIAQAKEVEKTRMDRRRSEDWGGKVWSENRQDFLASFHFLHTLESRTLNKVIQFVAYISD